MHFVLQVPSLTSCAKDLLSKPIHSFELSYPPVVFILAYCDVIPHLDCYVAALKECQRYGEKWSKKWAHEPTLIKVTAEIPGILARHGSTASKEAYPTWEKFLEAFLQRGTR